MKTIFLRGHDYKAKCWSEHAINCNIILIKGSRLLFPIKVVLLSFKYKSRNLIIVQRYLNDYPSIFKSIFLIIGDLFYLKFAKIRGIDVQWICHNIDKESHVHFKKLTNVRRKVLLKDISRILVTDECFVERAREEFNEFTKPIESISFGVYKNEIEIHKEDLKNSETKIGPNLAFKEIHLKTVFSILKLWSENNNLIGFCGGSYLEKKEYLKYAPNLVRAARKLDVPLKILLISDMSPTNNKSLYEELIEDEDIFFINAKKTLDLGFLASQINFYWTGYNDISMPYSIHIASSTHVPTLSLSMGIIPEILKKHNIGLVVKNDLGDLKEQIENLSNTAFTYNHFNNSHQWKSFGKAFQNA